MEDLKQIQEFFSKPLNENVYVEAFKLEKALKGMGHDVKVKYLDDFGKDVFEIYSKKPLDDDSIFYDAEKLGYSNVRVFDHSNESVDEASKEEETEFHTKLDKLVHDTFGKRKGEMEESVNEMDMNDPVMMKMRAAKDKLAKMRAANAGDDGNDKFFDAAKLRALKKKRAQIMRDMEQEAEMEGGPVADKYGDMLNKIDKAIAMLSEYNTGIYYKDEKTQDKAKEAGRSAMEKVKDMIQKVLKEEEGYSQYLKTDDNPEGKTKGLDTKTMNKILMNVIKDLDELKQLGEGVIEEELCPKGKAYIKKRQAAGEKSSAYLSGRAVKVCKGQMKG